MTKNSVDWSYLLQASNLPPYAQLRYQYRKQKGYLDNATFKNLGVFLYSAVNARDVQVRWDISDPSDMSVSMPEYHMWKMFFNSTPDEKERAARFTTTVFKVLTALLQPVSLRDMRSAAEVAKVDLLVGPRGPGERTCKATYAGGTTVLITWPCQWP